MIRGLLAAAVAIFALAFLADVSTQGGDKKDPVAIKVVMKRAMAGGLTKKVANGKANDEEKRELIALFSDLAANKSPHGDAKDWTKRTQALFQSAKTDDVAALKKALDCNGCHNEHK